MGGAINRQSFTQTDFEHFSHRLTDELKLLKQAIALPGFGSDPLKVGAELEMYLVDENGQVACRNQELITLLADPQFQPEINQYNIELNLSAVDVIGRPFSAMLTEMRDKTAHLEKVAASEGISVVPVGILPTLKPQHLQRDHMTDITRYKLLSDQLFQRRGESFKVNINGDEPVTMRCNDVTVEGANTSFQVHMMVEHKKFADTFNAAQLTSPLVIALAANSGLLLGKSVWDETRVALFKQSLDIRLRDQVQWQQPTRVAFGFGWVRQDAWELYSETVSLFEPILPMLFDQEPRQTWEKGQLPRLKELCLHMGTTWPWHRPVYSPEGKGHVRIEFRALPAGPTSIDMVANAALSIGLAVGMNNQVNDYLARIPFRYAEYNFYRAAQYGLDAKILWPVAGKATLQEVPIIQVIEQQLPMAEAGLQQLGVAQTDIDLFIGVIRQRLARRITGARWQKNTLKRLCQHHDRDTACQLLVQQYLANARSCLPVAEWE